MAQSPGSGDDSKKTEKVSPRKDFIGGYLGGMGIVVSGHPLDTIKVSQSFCDLYPIPNLSIYLSICQTKVVFLLISI